jgi:hypothetical protein
LWPDAIEPTEELIKEIKKGIRTVKNYPPIDVDNLPRVYVRPALSGIEEPTMIAIEPRKDEDGQTGKGDKSTSKDGDPKKAKAKPVEVSCTFFVLHLCLCLPVGLSTFMLVWMGYWCSCPYDNTSSITSNCNCQRTAA